MPRLSDDEYLARRKRLQIIWKYDMGLFAWLTQREQYALHDFFAIEDDFSDAEAVEHRKEIAESDGSLPHRAGRAFAHVVAEAEREAYARMHPQPQLSKRFVPQAERQLSVRAVYRPKPDLKKLARALWMMADDMKRAQDKDKAA